MEVELKDTPEQEVEIRVGEKPSDTIDEVDKHHSGLICDDSEKWDSDILQCISADGDLSLTQLIAKKNAISRKIRKLEETKQLQRLTRRLRRRYSNKELDELEKVIRDSALQDPEATYYQTRGILPVLPPGDVLLPRDELKKYDSEPSKTTNGKPPKPAGEKAVDAETDKIFNASPLHPPHLDGRPANTLQDIFNYIRLANAGKSSGDGKDDAPTFNTKKRAKEKAKEKADAKKGIIATTTTFPPSATALAIPLEHGKHLNVTVKPDFLAPQQTKLNAGAIAGISIASFLALILALLLMIYCIRRRKRGKEILEAYEDPDREPYSRVYYNDKGVMIVPPGVGEGESQTRGRAESSSSGASRGRDVLSRASSTVRSKLAGLSRAASSPGPSGDRRPPPPKAKADGRAYSGEFPPTHSNFEWRPTSSASTPPFAEFQHPLPRRHSISIAVAAASEGRMARNGVIYVTETPSVLPDSPKVPDMAQAPRPRPFSSIYTGEMRHATLAPLKANLEEELNDVLEGEGWLSPVPNPNTGGPMTAGADGTFREKSGAEGSKSAGHEGNKTFAEKFSGLLSRRSTKSNVKQGV